MILLPEVIKNLHATTIQGIAPTDEVFRGIENECIAHLLSACRVNNFESLPIIAGEIFGLCTNLKELNNPPLDWIGRYILLGEILQRMIEIMNPRVQLTRV